MICHICKQNTLYYENDEYNKYHIKCDICDLDLVSEIDLILYNFRLEKAFNTGKREQLLGNKVNPYPIDQVLLRKRWEEGWELGEQELEREAFISSAKNIKEEANKFFDMKEDIPYMNQVVKGKTVLITSATHVDATCRVQTVTEEQNPIYYKLLHEVGGMCNIPVLLNTSFNLKDQTITLDPDQAIKRFLESRINFLVINNFLIKKK